MNSQQNTKVREKTNFSNLKKYGQKGFNPVKCKKTNIDRYGFEFALHNSEILLKSKINFKKKSFISETGKTIKYNGYEKEIICYYFKAGISEDDLFFNQSDIPIVKYRDNGKVKTYFPNLYIKSKNLLISVKSSYSFDQRYKENMLKHKESINQGFNHIIIVWSVKNNCIDQIIDYRSMI